MINIVLVSNTCSNDYYKYLQSVKIKDKINPSQKFFDLLVNGLNFIDKENIKITCLSARSISRDDCKLKKLKENKETVNGIEYIYPKVKNKKLIRNIGNYINGYNFAKKIIKQNRKDGIQTIFIFDVLSYDIAAGAVKACKKQVFTCGIMTDIPSQMFAIGKGKKSIFGNLKLKLMNSLINKFDSYCFLTESMNVINTNNRPFTVIEGIVPYCEKELVKKGIVSNVVLYAGGLYEKFGLKSLVEACEKIEDKLDFELHLYGEGNLVEYICKEEAKHKSIKYKGSVGLEEILNLESNAKLLVNPRPAKEEFTKFSFPSKTMEYMSSGRPLITTKLGGIPEEYYKYCFVFDEETPQQMAEKLYSVLNMSEKELAEIGERAYKFVGKNKNNRIQAEKLWKFVIAESRKKHLSC